MITASIEPSFEFIYQPICKYFEPFNSQLDQMELISSYLSTKFQGLKLYLPLLVSFVLVVYNGVVFETDDSSEH